jgi:hypothetical protein
MTPTYRGGVAALADVYRAARREAENAERESVFAAPSPHGPTNRGGYRSFGSRASGTQTPGRLLESALTGTLDEQERDRIIGGDV